MGIGHLLLVNVHTRLEHGHVHVTMMRGCSTSPVIPEYFWVYSKSDSINIFGHRLAFSRGAHVTMCAHEGFARTVSASQVSPPKAVHEYESIHVEYT